MPKDLAKTCLYTTRLPKDLKEAAGLRGPTTFVVNRRMKKAKEHYLKAKADGLDYPVLFSDATCCKRLIYVARLIRISVGKEDTHFTVFDFVELDKGRVTQKLVKDSNGKRIAPDFIRPYAIVKTPKFLKAVR